MRLLIGLILLLSATIVFAQADTTDYYTENKTAILVTSDHPQFVIKLKSNATTGYSWFLKSFDANLIQPVKHKYEAPIDKKLMGAPGSDVWTFRVKPAGFSVPQQTSIRLVYARPWESNGQETQLVFRVATTSGPSASHSGKQE